MNRSVLDIGGGVLAISTVFTLYGDCRKGRRPSFVQAAPPPVAERLYERFLDLLAEQGPAAPARRLRRLHASRNPQRRTGHLDGGVARVKPLILGSASPRRAALLRQLALPFTVVPSPLAEPVPATSIPADYALESAVAKARAVASVVAAERHHHRRGHHRL